MSNRSKRKVKRKAKRGYRESTLPTGQAGRVLDRLLLLEKVVPPGDIRQVLETSGCLDARRCTLPFEVACWMALALGVLTDLPLRQVFEACRRLYPGEDTPHRSSLCRARRRLGVGPLRLLFGRIARPLADVLTPGAFSKGLRLGASTAPPTPSPTPRPTPMPSATPRAVAVRVPFRRCGNSAWWSWALTPSRRWCCGASGQCLEVKGRFAGRLRGWG